MFGLFCWAINWQSVHVLPFTVVAFGFHENTSSIDYKQLYIYRSVQTGAGY